MRMLSALILLCCVCGTPAWAGDIPAKPDAGIAQWSPAKTFFFGEGMAALNSAFAAASPPVTGGIILFTAPLVFAESRGPLGEDIVGTAAYAGIGALDISYSRDYSRRQVFAQNFLAWNLVGGALLLMERHGRSGTAAKLAQHVAVLPRPGGGLQLDCHWTF